MMKSFIAAVAILTAAVNMEGQNTMTLESSNGSLSAQIRHTTSKAYIYLYDANGVQLTRILLGVKCSNTNYDFTYMKFQSASEIKTVTEDYTTIHGKKSHPHNEAQAVTTHYLNRKDLPIDVEVRLYNDGLAFRYIIPNEDKTTLTFSSEATSFEVATATKRWLQDYNVSYENDFLYQSTVKQGEYCFPALFQRGDTWFLVTEANAGRMYCDCHLNNNDRSTTYVMTYPGANEGGSDKPVNPSWSDNWTSPWRVVIAGTLGTIVESTLVEDVSDPCTMTNTDFVQPGRAAWVYWAYNHGTKDYQICKQYVDLAVAMGWEYVLFDWEWDQMGNGGNINDAVNYAKSKGIKPMVWYDSSDGRMTDRSRRVSEFAWLKSIGIVGVKIDFFLSDKQYTMNYFLDVLEDAIDAEMLVNFHGATLPRGWSRTYPHLMSTEAVFGAEMYNNGSYMTEHGSEINCVHVFTRNVVGPMDYTPVAFTNSQHPHVTSFAHELALSVAFESGIQHWADRPEGFYALPDEARQHMSEVPAAWDDIHFISGYPRESFVVARRSGMDWYVAGLNGKSEPVDFTVPLDFLGNGTFLMTQFADGSDTKHFSITHHSVSGADVLTIHTLSQGGFVLSFRAPATYEQLQSLLSDARTAINAVDESNIGENTGQYDKDITDALSTAITTAEAVTTSTPEAELNAAYVTLADAFSAFQTSGLITNKVVGEMEDTEDVTKEYLYESRNFSRSDESSEPTSRFGLLAEPWIVTDNILNQDNFSHGGFDSFEGGRAISLEMWEGSLPAIENGKIYQTTRAELPAGTYHLHINVTCRAGLTDGACLLRVVRGDDFPDKGVDDDRVLAAYDMSKTAYSGEYDVCTFTLDSPQTVSLGWLFNLPENATGHALRVTAIRLLDNSNTDLSSSYIGNYQNIQRKDRSYKRFGIPTYWDVSNFSIDNGTSGVKNGIDSYPGYNCLMLGVWDDRNKAVGDVSQANLWRTVTLPAGRYFFGASYNTCYNISRGYIYAAQQPLTADGTEANALACYPLSGTPSDDDFYGVTFALETEAEVALGWNADLTTANQQEFRVKAVTLRRYPEHTVPTGIECVAPWDNLPVDSTGIYDLTGRRIATTDGQPTTPLKGLYVINGKKVLIR